MRLFFYSFDVEGRNGSDSQAMKGPHLYQTQIIQAINQLTTTISSIFILATLPVANDASQTYF